MAASDVKTTEVPSSPRRGRPPQSEESAAAARARIVEATAQVFAERGSHGLSVALIIERAGIARPTFYRYFANAEEPLQQILDASDMALVYGLQAALDRADDEVGMVVKGIDAYLAWARNHGPALRPLFAELHDPSSPVSPHRERTLDMLRERLIARFVKLGRTPPPSIDIDVLLHAFEYVGFRVALGDAPDATADWARLTMARIAVVLLGTPADLEQALRMPGLLRPEG
ncbi:MAG: TetR/AcrR family transcriptional regulator [Jatrophihabitans sp.]|uniref:TetR/AcrR family transcriptional regulator n=1 Tax=Jatrophihabitans sp. TaxID=1932789 RepID=UPI00390FF997